MSFSFGFGGQSQAAPAFGASSPSLFGATPSTPFGGQPASSPFGQTGGGMFGAAAAPAFGQPSTPAFGTPASTPAFGSTGFGAAPAASSFGSFGASPAFGQSLPAFGAQPAQAAPAFGAQATSAFGAQSTPAFGAGFGGGGAFGGGGGAFGAKPAFGASSSPAFGAASTPAFGQTPGGFGAAAPAFGQGGGGFGAPQQQAAGTRSVAWRKTAASDSTSGKSDGNYLSIVAMPEYAGKSFEELRWEDYQAGCKGNTGGMPAGTSGFGQSPGGFGSQSPQPFGTPSAGFGAASTPAFGQTQSMPAFGASSTPAFGSSGFGTGTPAFGQSSAPAFGQSSAPAFGQTPAFGSQSPPAFGGGFPAPQSTPAFGGGATSNPFGQSTPAFGSTGGFGFGTPQQSSSGFGTPQSTPAFGSTGFGGFGQSSTAFAAPPPGAAAPPAFGQQPQQQSTPAFSFSTGGGFGTPQQSPGFGAAPTPGFGAASAPSFGNLFGNNQQNQQKPGGFGGFGQSNPAGGFGASSTPGFGQSQSNGMFGAPAQSGSAFGGTFGQPAPAFGSTGFGQPTQQQQPFMQQPQQQQQLVPSDPNNPYGQLPDPPKIPDYPVGLAAKPGLGTVFSRSSPLLAPRPISRPLAGSTYGKPAAAGRSRSRSTTPASSDSALSMEQAAPSTALVLTPRSNPRHLFVSSQLPSTGAAPSISPSPTSAPSAPSQTANGQDDKPSSSRQAGTTPDAPPQRGHAGQSTSRDRQLADEMPEDDGSDDTENLSDAQIKGLLPKLDGTDFVVSPSLHQLADLARSGGASELGQVQSFMVEHKTWGSVRWLEPVDVRSLVLKDLVQISRRNILVYPTHDAAPQKPAMGDGLNKPAEVSLYKILPREKGVDITDPIKKQKWIRRLQETATKQSTEFVSYDPDRGIWKFRVDHFSRYGLSDSDCEFDDDEDDGGSQVPMQEKTQTQQQKQTQPPKQASTGVTDKAAPVRQGYGLFEEDELMDDDSGSDQTGGVDLDMGTDRDFDPASQPMSRATSGDMMGQDEDMQSPGPEPAQRSPELALALASGYQHNPEQLLDMQQALFNAPETEGPVGNKRRSRSSGPEPAIFTKPNTNAESRAPNSWKRTQPALQPPASIFDGSVVSPDRSGAHALIQSGGSSSPAQQAAEPINFTKASGCVADAGLMLGQSCRVGWGPNGLLVIPGGGSSQSSLAFKHIVHLPSLVCPCISDTASLQEKRKMLKQQEEQQRNSLEQALKLHQRTSLPLPLHASGTPGAQASEMMDDETAPSASVSVRQEAEEQIPQWQLRCSREAELQQLCDELCALPESNLQNVGQVQKAVWQQQRHTWSLLAVLYAAIPDTSVVHLPDSPSLVDMQRRANLSRWLQDAAKSGMQHASQDGSPGTWRVAQLLSGHQTAAAAVLAASMGDVRLASLLAQAGLSAAGQAHIRSQLEVWQQPQSGWDTQPFIQHISEDRLLIYQLLAGHVEEVIPKLDLDWRRALGLYFWYNQPTTASTAQVLSSYAASVNRQTVPYPQPVYQEEEHVAPPESSSAVGATDFQLLRLAADDLDVQQSGMGLAELLRPAGATPDPLDHLFAWQLLTVLQAIDALRVEGKSGCAMVQVFQLHLSLVAQLEALKGMAHWAVYVALHLPNHSSPDWPHLRENVVQELLMRHASEWVVDAPNKRKFLLKELQLPAAWLDQSLAQWAHYCQDDSGELDNLLKAGLWPEVHQLLCLRLAPQLFLASYSQHNLGPTEQQQQMEDKLQGLLSQLQAHSHQLALPTSRLTHPEADWRARSWAEGAGVYSTYYSLRDEFRSADRSRNDKPQQQRMTDYLKFAEQLEAVSSIWRRGPSSTLRQVVLSELSGQVASWLLKDAAAVRPPAKDMVPLKPPTSNSLEMQLSANWLAQHTDY